MRSIKVAVVAISLFFVFFSHTASAVSVGQPPVNSVKPDMPILVTGYAFSGPKLLYVQLFNGSSSVVNLENITISYIISGQAEAISVANLEGLIKPGGYVVVGERGSVPAADFGYSLNIPPEVTGNVTAIKVSSPQYTEANVAVKADPNTLHWKRNISVTSGNYLSTFSSFVPASNFVLYGNGLYIVAESTSLQFTEILANPRNCSPAETAGDCFDFVKIYNPTLQPIELSQFRLRVGFHGQSASSSNTFALSGIVPAGGYLAIKESADARLVSLTNSGAYVWLEDTYGIQRYDSTITEYPDASSETKKGQAWAYDPSDGVWKWTLQPTPTNLPSVFVFPAPKPKVVASSSLAPCKEGQYRSEETNRCRSLASAVTALAPCDEDEERNLDTNRCRKIASALTADLVPCKEGQERNPETNRCRNVAAASPPDAAFKAEPIAETGKAFVGWWALGGIGLLAVGYGVWEWRQEILGGLQKVATFFTSGK